MTDSHLQELRIGPDKEVTLHFALKLDNGDVVDSTFDKKPATFKVGDGNLLPGFEQAACQSVLSKALGRAIRRISRSCRAASFRIWNCLRGCW
jgi:hypothetical protein